MLNMSPCLDRNIQSRNVIIHNKFPISWHKNLSNTIWWQWKKCILRQDLKKRCYRTDNLIKTEVFINGKLHYRSTRCECFLPYSFHKCRRTYFVPSAPPSARPHTYRIYCSHIGPLSAPQYILQRTKKRKKIFYISDINTSCCIILNSKY